ncbi:MAG: vitamin B12-dependent ribonucleotide reductase [Labilithrix sp.]|nr:vitamin B12-dependent ribonucleotide reductase [Labilithrix sp.]MCW5814507.1 vitamin B12-dependent ribonucleotide reductase [Labilithrix sp.]
MRKQAAATQAKARPAQAQAQAQKKSERKSSPSLHTPPRKGGGRGVTVARMFTRPGVDPLESGAPGLPTPTGQKTELVYERRSSIITNPDGSIVFKMEGAEIPSQWSQLATDIVISKYFRKAGLHGDAKVGEKSVRQVVHRIAHTIRDAADKFGGYFATKADADAFEAELSFLMVHQAGAFNSPVWFNCGLWAEYGITGSGGNWAAAVAGLPGYQGHNGAKSKGPAQTQVFETKNAYERPQCSACFIQSANDDLMSIYDLIKAEARLFKYGSGTGSNFSNIRGRQEKLSGGGTSSGLMSFLEVFDRAAGATKSGGTTRRAAKMVCLDMDHPEIEDFINWKVREEKKALALIAAGYPNDFNGEAYHTVSGQNSNNSVRVTDEFMTAVKAGGKWQTIMRTSGEVCETLDAKNLWGQVAKAAWHCADPGVQYDSTINRWHTCPNSGKINASNPCSEYMFLDDTACNLSSINLTKFLKESEDGVQSFDVDGFRHACRVFFMAQEILVDLSSYPTEQIARNSHDYRPLGLGYANLGSLLMQMGVPYDSDEGRAIAGALTAIMCGKAYATSAEMASTKGAFVGFAKNREPMLKVMGMHRDAAYQINRDKCPTALYRAACEDWDVAVRLGEAHGYRNAQATVLAPTGTIGLLMDCDTTGVEPDFALVKFKKLAGGGYFKIVNQSVPSALKKLGYSASEIQEIVAFVTGTNTLLAAPNVNRKTLKDRGLRDEELAKAEAALPGLFDLDSAFAPWVLGEDTYDRLGVTKEARSVRGFSLLTTLGFTKAEIDEAADHIIGRMTIEGAPYLKPSHYPVFDCANRCGKTGQRFLPAMSHVHMMAAVQPFLSGAISKTVNLPNDATVEEVQEVYEEGWRLGLKAVALYRDGCKASQPLSTKKDSEKEEKLEAKLSETQHSGETLAPIPKTSEPQETTQLSLLHAGGATAAAGSRPKGLRVRLPKKRVGFTQEARVGGHKIFLRTGQYEDGTLGEIFIDMHKEGAAFRSMMNCFAMSVSIGLQYGVPLATYVEQFTFTRFEPQGIVEGHPYVKMATSIVDYLFRTLAVEYLGRYDLAHVKPESEQEIPHAGFVGGGIKEDRPSDSERIRAEAAHSLAYTPEAIQRIGAEAETLERTDGYEAAALATPGKTPEPKAKTAAHAYGSSEPVNPLDAQLDAMMGDAPVCDGCGHITVRNGACYKCLNCGNSMGCS